MKWLLIVVAVLVAVGGLVTLVGAGLPQHHTASRSARLSAPPESVWSIITDVSSYPAWRKDVDSVELISRSPLLSWREKSGSDRITYEAATSEPPSHFVARIADEGLPFGGSWEYKIIPDGAGTAITITENGEVYNPLFRFVSRYLIGHTATIDKYLGALSARTGDRYQPSGN